jgi:hypothetical protein
MFAIQTVDQAATYLSGVYAERLFGADLSVTSLRGPVGLFLVREDGAAGSKLAKEIVGSFQYWNARSEQFFDGVFLAWGYDGFPAYLGDEEFVACVQDLEAKLNWQYKGRAQLLLADFVYDVAQRRGDFDFSSTMDLDISALLDDKKIAQLGSLIEDLVRPAKTAKDRDPTVQPSVWDISDYIAVLRTRRFWWHQLVHRVGTLLGWADDVMPYATRDLRKV